MSDSIVIDIVLLRQLFYRLPVDLKVVDNIQSIILACRFVPLLDPLAFELVGRRWGADTVYYGFHYPAFAIRLISLRCLVFLAHLINIWLLNLISSIRYLFIRWTIFRRVRMALIWNDQCCLMVVVLLYQYWVVLQLHCLSFWIQIYVLFIRIHFGLSHHFRSRFGWLLLTGWLFGLGFISR